MDHTSRTKDDLRRSLLAARRSRTAADRRSAGDAIAAHASGARPLTAARRVAAYLPMPEEPSVTPLLAQLVARGVEVLVPVTGPDHTLGWAVHVPDAPTARSALGIDEPVTAPLPASALATVDVVLVPALAVDHRGRRLGRGAGYYDRALAALPHDGRPLLCAVVFADELLPEVPHEPHDVPVDLVLTDGGLFRPEG